MSLIPGNKIMLHQPIDLQQFATSSPASARPLRVAFIVTEFPKVTETFVMRDVMECHRLGCEVRIFHLTPFNDGEIIHDFAAETVDWSRGYAYLASREVLGASAAAVLGKGGTIAAIVRDIMRGARRDPVMMLKSLFILPKSLRIARELQEWGADHVHAAFAGHPATAAWIAQRVTGIPFSVSSHAHDLFETQALLAEKLPEAAFVRTISHYNRDFILRHVPDMKGRPLEVIRVGTYPAEAPRAPRPVDGRFRVLYVGSLEFRKGVDVLLRAFAEVREAGWQLDVIGGGPEREKLEALAGTLGLGSSATFHGPKTNEEVRTAMAGASVMVVPSRIGPRNQTEGLPTVLVEALSLHTPVIATRLTGIPELVRDRETGLLAEIDDVAGFAAALRQIHADPERAQAWADAGRKVVEEEFDQTRNAQRLLGLVRASLVQAPQVTQGAAVTPAAA